MGAFDLDGLPGVFDLTVTEHRCIVYTAWAWFLEQYGRRKATRYFVIGCPLPPVLRWWAAGCRGVG